MMRKKNFILYKNVHFWPKAIQIQMVNTKSKV